MNHPLESFTLTPMSAGDIIDRAVRLYRHNFIVLLRIVLAPSIVAFVGAILYTIGFRNISLDRGDSRLIATGFMIVIGFLLMIIGKAAFYAVLGGASRSLVHHFFDGTPLRARDVYQAVRERLWSLIGATLMLGLTVFIISTMLVVIFMTMFSIYAVFLTLVAISQPVWVQVITHITFGVVTFALVVFMALICYSRIVYVPQVLMVEGKGVFSSIGRSFSLAGGAVTRIAAISLFWIYVAWSIWWLLMIPPGWYAYWLGVDINPFRDNGPLWYIVLQQTLAQVSEILIAPIGMLGFTLLYLDSRVRKEGFDIELLANRVLSAPPAWTHPVPLDQPYIEPQVAEVPELIDRAYSEPNSPEVAEIALPEESSVPSQTAT
jgi:hypothetical protein